MVRFRMYFREPIDSELVNKLNAVNEKKKRIKNSSKAFALINRRDGNPLMEIMKARRGAWSGILESFFGHVDS